MLGYPLRPRAGAAVVRREGRAVARARALEPSHTQHVRDPSDGPLQSPGGRDAQWSSARMRKDSREVQRPELFRAWLLRIVQGSPLGLEIDGSTSRTVSDTLRRLKERKEGVRRLF